MFDLKKRLASVVLSAMLVIAVMPLASMVSYADEVEAPAAEEITEPSVKVIEKNNTGRFGEVPFTTSAGTVDSEVGTISYSVIEYLPDENGNWNPASETKYAINLYTVHVADADSVTVEFKGGNFIAYGYGDSDKTAYLNSCGNSGDGSYAYDSPGEATAVVRKAGDVFPDYVFVQTPFVGGASEDLYAIHIASDAKDEPAAEEQPDHTNTSEVIASYMSNKVGDEWYAMSLARDGKPVPEDYFKALGEEVKAKEGKIAKITDAAKYVLALTAGGYDATQVEGYDLVAEMAAACEEKIAANKLDAYSAIYALLALDSHDYLNTEEGNNLRSDIIKAALKAKLWDVDTKGMLVQALAPYMNDDKVLDSETKQAVIDKVNELDASFDSGLASINNSNTLAQVILAKVALGKDAAPALEMLKDYELENGAYCWKPDKNGKKAENKMATYQAYQAVISADNAKAGRNSFYEMSDVKELKPLGENKKPEEPGTDEPEPEKTYTKSEYFTVDGAEKDAKVGTISYTDYTGAHNVDLYTVKVKEGAESFTMNFDDDRIVYAYGDDTKDGSKWLGSCGSAADGSYAGGGTVGERAAIVRTNNGEFPPYLYVQTPYDKNWSSTDLYVVKVEVEKAKAEEPAVTPAKPAATSTHTTGYTSKAATNTAASVAESKTAKADSNSTADKVKKEVADDESGAETKSASNDEVSSHTMMYVGAGIVLFLLALLVLRKLIKESSK